MTCLMTCLIPSHPIQNALYLGLYPLKDQYLLLNPLWHPQILLSYLLHKHLFAADSGLGARDMAESETGTISSLKTSKAQRHTLVPHKMNYKSTNFLSILLYQEFFPEEHTLKFPFRHSYILHFSLFRLDI